MTDAVTPPTATTATPPRPSVTLGATLVVIGGILMIAGSLLNWFDLDGATFDGFTSGLENVTDVKGEVFGVFGVIVVGFGTAQLAAKKVLAIGIIGAAVCAIAVGIALTALSDIDDFLAPFQFFGADVSTGPGLYVVILGALVATVGSIATIIKKPA